jgi:membrane protein
VIGLTMILIVLGNNIFAMLLRLIPQLSTFYGLFKYGKYVVMPILLILFFQLVYMNVPNRKSKIRYELPGAMFSTVVWLAYSWAFSFYISNYANYSVTYGSLATIVIFILWLYVTMNIVFIGAEINVVLRQFAEYGYNFKLVFMYYQDLYKNE